MAVVAAAGARGIPADEVVRKRRQYAQHLGIELKGSTQDGDEPGHIRWAIKYSNHNTDANDPNGRVNLGRARASEQDGRLFLTWTANAKPRFVSVPFYVEQDGSKTLFLPTLATANGFQIGAKDDERWVGDYWQALGDVLAMAAPRFRRPNGAGNRGIVTCRPGDREDVKFSYIAGLIGQVSHG